jgi:hypothetical protein
VFPGRAWEQAQTIKDQVEDMESNAWRDFFSRWPADLHHQGLAVTTFNEQIPFSAFWLGERLLILERQTPDQLGARAVILPYEQIIAVKITNVIKPRQFKAAGFDVAAAKG